MILEEPSERSGVSPPVVCALAAYIVPQMAEQFGKVGHRLKNRGTHVPRSEHHWFPDLWGVVFCCPGNRAEGLLVIRL